MLRMAWNPLKDSYKLLFSAKILLNIQKEYLNNRNQSALYERWYFKNIYIWLCNFICGEEEGIAKEIFQSIKEKHSDYSIIFAANEKAMLIGQDGEEFLKIYLHIQNK